MSNYKSGSGCIYGEKCRFRRVETDGRPNKKSKKSGVKCSVVLLKESISLHCASQDSHPIKIYPKERLKIGIKSHRQIIQGHVTPHENSGKKGSIARRHSKVRTAKERIFHIPKSKLYSKIVRN